MEPVRGFDRLDTLGLCLAGSLVAWTLASALVAGGNPVPPVLLLGGCVTVFALSRRAAGDRPVAVPGLLVVAGLLLFALDPLGIAGSGAGSGPFGYANAKAAFYVLAAVAALMVATREGSPLIRIGAVLAGLAFALVAPASEARTATIVAATLPIVGIVAIREGPRRTFIVVCVVGVLAASLGTATMALSGDAASFASSLGSRRVRLWEEAADLMVAHPWFGVGTGRFAAESLTGSSDADARWAHHDFLDLGAESGVPAFVLLLLLFMWALARIGSSTVHPSTAILAAFAVAVLATMASFDYVLHFPVIVLVGTALAGTGAPLRSRRGWQPSSPARALVKAATLPLGVVRPRRPGDVVILLYHRVGIGDREIDVPKDAFGEQMAVVAGSGEVRSLDEALHDPRGGVVVTFDDGYRDFHEHALPTLVRHGVPSVLYLATGLVGDLPEALTWSQLEEAVSTGLVEIGSHTHGHSDLSRADERTADREMRRCKELIEDRLGRPCRHFAYPWAVGSAAADRVARRMFDSAALEAWRVNRRGRIDRHRLGRTPVLRGDGSLFFRAKTRGMLDGERIAYRILRRGPWRPS
jgi:peptidoglycan/xylan/chitin deacetylase (PgdA/CDA1 family)/O-antigen ligase